MEEAEIRLPIARPSDDDRRALREPVEMMAKLRSAFTTCTVVLKDLTRFGARIEGLGLPEIDEAVTLGLPACRPFMAFVAWTGRHGIGLEFAEPLDAAVYADLVARHGLGRHTERMPAGLQGTGAGPGPEPGRGPPREMDAGIS